MNGNFLIGKGIFADVAGDVYFGRLDLIEMFTLIL